MHLCMCTKLFQVLFRITPLHLSEDNNSLCADFKSKWKREGIVYIRLSYSLTIKLSLIKLLFIKIFCK